MAGITDFITKNASPIGMAAQGIGGVMNVIGAFGQKKEAKKQLSAQNRFAGQQRGLLESGFSNLLTQAGNLPTYKGDISKYEQMTQTAQEQLQKAGGRIAGADIAREQIAQQTANVLGAASRGARSSQDLLSSVLFGQGQAAEQTRIQEGQFMQMQQQRQQQAQQNLLSVLGQTAAAAAQQRGLEFESQLQKANTILGLKQQRFGAQMDLEQQLFDSEQAKRAALANARAAIWSGIGDIASNVGSGMMENQRWNNLMAGYSQNNTNNTDIAKQIGLTQ